MSPGRKYHLRTFGCQMNERDSERMGEFLHRAGYAPAARPEEADVILVNTCSVRQKPEQKAISELGRYLSLKRLRSELVVGIAGCVAQQEGPRLLSRFEGLDMVIGTRHFHRVPEFIQRVEEGERVCAIEMDEADAGQMFSWAGSGTGKVSSFVTIMQGCDNYCAYCVVPYVRGPEVSRKVDDIISEVKDLVQGGVREVTLLGQNVNSYGKGLGLRFPELLRRVAEVEGIRRVRFTTSHPRDLSEELIAVMASHPHIMEHIHLPVQAGSNKVLEAMNRGYTREHYLELVQRLRKAMPEIGITTDLIVGFPHETEDDFQQTMELIEQVRYDETFSFRYTPRPGTAAAKLEDDVPEQVKYERLYRLQERQRQITEEKNKAQIGLVHEVLALGPSSRDPARITGRTRTNRLVHFRGPKIKPGALVSVRITQALKHSLLGEVSSIIE